MIIYVVMCRLMDVVCLVSSYAAITHFFMTFMIICYGYGIENHVDSRMTWGWTMRVLRFFVVGVVWEGSLGYDYRNRVDCEVTCGLCCQVELWSVMNVPCVKLFPLKVGLEMCANGLFEFQMSFGLWVSELIMILRRFCCENEKKHKALARLWVIL